MIESGIEEKWQDLNRKLKSEFNKELSFEAILVMVGMREMGFAPRVFAKAEKVDLMHVAICKLLEPSGFYKQTLVDEDGWPHFELIKPLPDLKLYSQVQLIKQQLIYYFEEIYEIKFGLSKT